VSLQSLEICGLTTDLLQEFQKVLSSMTHDRVQIKSDGSYMLLAERKVRKRKRPRNGNDPEHVKLARTETEHDVIDLL
jgi:hypothetical protein